MVVNKLFAPLCGTKKTMHTHLLKATSCGNYNAFYYWQRKIREDFAASALQIPQKDAPAPEFATLATATVTVTVQTATLPSMLKLSCGPVSLEAL